MHTAKKEILGFHLIISLILIYILSEIGPVESNRSFYGEGCNKTIKCDKGSWLGCFEGTCSCLKQDEMLYDVDVGKCVSKAGERCKYALEEDTGEDDEAENGNGKKILYEVTSCVSNASCNGEGVCSCDRKFYENPNGTCTFARLHGQSCDSESHCSVYQGLQCTNGICQCDLENSVFLENPNPDSFSDSQCVGLVGKSCLNGRCTSHAICSKGICVCESEYYPDEENKCHPKNGPLEKCTTNYQCQSKPGLNLTCIDGICNCDPNISMYATAQKAERYRYDPDIFSAFMGDFYTQCVGLAGSICLDRLCVPRAFCSYSFLNDFSGTCKCLGGYYQSNLGTCGHRHGESCDAPDACLPGFYCQDQICSCQFDIQEYDPSRKICFSKVGGPCNNSNQCAQNAQCHFNSYSNSNSNSTSNSTAKVGAGHCVCKEGFLENISGDCEIKYGGTCEFTTQCDSIARLKCINNKCECGAFSEYSDELRSCVGLVGAKCDVEDGNSCVKNARCKRSHPKLMGSCTCLEEDHETFDYHCT